MPRLLRSKSLVLACFVLLVGGLVTEEAQARKFGYFRFGRAAKGHAASSCTGVTGQIYSVTITDLVYGFQVQEFWLFDTSGLVFSTNFDLFASEYSAKRVTFRSTLLYSFDPATFTFADTTLTVRGWSTCSGSFFHATGHLQNDFDGTRRVIITGVLEGSSSNSNSSSSSSNSNN